MTAPRVSGYAIAQRQTTAALKELVAGAHNEEEKLQEAVIDLLEATRIPGVVYWHTPNGGRRSKREAVKFKRMGVLAGVSDLIISIPGARMAFLELKSRRGRLSEEQEAFIAGQEANGFTCGMAKTLDEAVKFLTDVGAIRAAKVNA
jgi:hypothetical protein